MNSIGLIITWLICGVLMLCKASKYEHTQRLNRERAYCNDKLQRGQHKAFEREYLEAQRTTLWNEHIERG